VNDEGFLLVKFFCFEEKRFISEKKSSG